jgi:hypothetical protein
LTAPIVSLTAMYDSATGIFAHLTVMNLAKTPPNGPVTTKFVSKVTLHGPEAGENVTKSMMYVAESAMIEPETAICATLL